MTRLGTFLRNNKYFLLAHHPACDQFHDDVFFIKSTAFCIGCFVAIPALIIFHIFAQLTDIFDSFSLLQLLIASIICSSFYILGKFKLHSFKWLNIFSKIMVGIGGGFLIQILWLFEISNSFRYLTAFLLIQIAFLGHGILRAWSIYRTCKKCEYNFKWSECPGMHEIIYQLDKGF